MTVISVEKDPDALTLALVAEFDARPERVWQVWEDPRQLEQWWGPPGWPATFDEHRFFEGGRSTYYMSGPSGEKSQGWWQFHAIDAPVRIEFFDGFADEHGEPIAGMEPIRIITTLEPVGDRTRMTIMASFADPEQYEQVLDMGMEEGLRQAVGQIDEILSR